jgi:hypothetical protein
MSFQYCDVCHKQAEYYCSRCEVPYCAFHFHGDHSANRCGSCLAQDEWEHDHGIDNDDDETNENEVKQ